MLGFSIQKLLFTVAVIAAVWYGFKWLGRMKEVRDRQARERLRPDADGAPQPGAPGTEEMVECGRCGAYVSAAAPRSCGRADCPYSA